MKAISQSVSIAALGLLCLSTASAAANLEPTLFRGNVVVEKSEIGIVVGLDESNTLQPSDDWLDRVWVLQSDLPTKEHVYFSGPAEIEMLGDALVVYLTDSQNTLVLRLANAEDPEVSPLWGEPFRFEGLGLINMTPPTRQISLLAATAHYGYIPNPDELQFPLKHGPLHDDTGNGCGFGPSDPDPNCAGEGGGGGGSGGNNGCSKSCSATCPDGSYCSVVCVTNQKAECNTQCSLSGVVVSCFCSTCI